MTDIIMAVARTAAPAAHLKELAVVALQPDYDLLMAWLRWLWPCEAQPRPYVCARLD